jgi:undecaprenyl diphosphate synthase
MLDILSDNLREMIVKPIDVPRHVAIIMDGNRRWARSRHLPVIEGHRRGAKTLRAICRAARDAGVEILTVYAFSKENWSRERVEVNLLLELCRHFAQGELAALRAENVRVQVLGRMDMLPTPTREALHGLIDGTAHCDGLLLNLAINYSSRMELTDAVRSIAADVASGMLSLDAVNEDLISNRLYTKGLPDPELLIRTGGELRISNFLLFQIAYTELWSTSINWPEFTPSDLQSALQSFAQRKRRFGA